MVKFLLAVCFVSLSIYSTYSYRLKVITVATDETDGYNRFMRSAKFYGLDVDVFGMHEEWLGGDMQNGPGGGHKINILRKNLKKYKDEKDLLLMFTDSYDVVFAEGEKEILRKYESFNATILFSAEDFCWPDKSLAKSYPAPEVENGQAFLCSGGIIAPASKFYEVITMETVTNTDDDQLYYTKIYLDKKEKYGMKLDHASVIFQNLNGNKDQVELNFDQEDTRLKNTRFSTFPSVVHGNGPSKLHLDHLANYISNGWNFHQSCISCKENTYVLKDIKEEKWPRILIGLFIPAPTPFVQSFLRHISNLEYPKKKIDIFLHSADPYHNPHIEEWMKEFEESYNSFTYKGPRSFLTEKEGRNLGIAHCKKIDCDYYFSVDGEVTLSNRKALQVLLEQNRTLLVPMLSKSGKLWSNFWGAIGRDGFYARSPDYIDIVKNIRRGVWNVPFVSNAYLIKRSTIKEMVVNPFYGDENDQDMNFCENNRQRGVFMYVTNMEHFGHLKETDTYSTNYKHNDLYQIFDNRLDWEDRYLHPNYTHFLNPKSTPVEPCPDVYWFPFVTENYTKEMIEECEHLGEWSGGKHEDKRISGGYENVPTVDIHMKQIGFEKQWLQMLKDYVAPMCSRYFTGYYSHSQAIMNFVVKYTPNGQFYLRPHHDASTFTINMALNKRGVDYQGGGARFLRYNCSVQDTQVGWALMHPGRLTHQHEGLETKSGRRYIMVSFIDP